MEIENYTDQEIVKAILDRDTIITKEFLYGECYPLFKAVYDKYYTDCESCFELINEIYVYIMIPQKKTGISKLAAFGFRCTLTMWLKIVVENYCHQLFAKRIETNNGDVDRLERIGSSINKEIRNFSMEDAYKVLKQMPNEQRYHRLIELRYLLDKTNKETAELLSMIMPNYYNKHKLAKAQLYVTLRKEDVV